jgi:hypothetical protein
LVKKKRRAGSSAARAAALQTELDRERRSGRIAGVIALGSVACWLGALMFANGAGGASTQVGRGEGLGDPAPLSSRLQLLDFHAGAGDQAIATALRCAGLLLSAAFGVYLYRLIRARKPSVSRRLPWIAVAGAALVAGSTVFGYFALGHVATEFVSSGARTSARATHLLDSAGAVKGAAGFDLASRAVFAVWIALTSLEMMRVGLLDKFLGYWGLAACGSIVLLPIGDAMFVAWLGSIGIMALGYWPGGRTEGWRRIMKPC